MMLVRITGRDGGEPPSPVRWQEAASCRLQKKFFVCRAQGRIWDGKQQQDCILLSSILLCFCVCVCVHSMFLDFWILASQRLGSHIRAASHLETFAAHAVLCTAVMLAVADDVPAVLANASGQTCIF